MLIEVKWHGNAVLLTLLKDLIGLAYFTFDLSLVGCTAASLLELINIVDLFLMLIYSLEFIDSLRQYILACDIWPLPKLELIKTVLGHRV